MIRVEVTGLDGNRLGVCIECQTGAPSRPGLRCAWLLPALMTCVVPASATPVEDLAIRVDALVAPLVEAREFSGAVVLSRGGAIIYRRGFGLANHAAGVAFTPDTPADGGSLAKTFTAAGIWWLVQEGRLDLEAPVSRYLPDFPHAATTVRHLISHSNGLPPYYEFFDPWFAPGEVRTTQDLLRAVARHAPEPAFLPGTRFEYSNLGFDAAALVIEQVTGQDYPTFVKERFFDPLKLASSFARPARFADWNGVRTLGYRWLDGAWQTFDVFDGEAFLGASNLYFSTADLARWASAFAAGSAVPPVVFAQGQQRGPIDGKPSPITGLSWYCDASGNRCHYTGSLNAFHGFAYWDRQRNEAVAFLSNSSVPPWRIIALQRDLVDTLAGRSLQQGDEPVLVSMDAGELASLAGTWAADEVGTLTLVPRPDGPGLRLTDAWGLEFDVFPVSREVLYVPGPDYWLGFTGDARAPSLVLRSMYRDATFRRSSGDVGNAGAATADGPAPERSH